MIRNILDGKCYIGSAVNLARRKKEHINRLRLGLHHCRHLQSAWTRDGEDAFLFFTLAFVGDVRHLVDAEQLYIDSYRAADHRYGYNSRPVAGSNLGHKFSPETIERNRLARLGKPLSVETRQRQSLAAKGVAKSATHAKNIARAKTGKPRPDVSQWAPEKLSRFDSATVLRIRGEKRAGATLKQLAQKYGCSIATASYVVRGIGAYYSTI